MSYLLCIDTALQTGYVALSHNGKCIAVKSSTQQQEHAAFVQPAIAAILEEQQVSLKEVRAVAVSNGPGSYTGLRVGLASAKGLCYALNIPLITLSTLRLMATAMANEVPSNQSSPFLLCPMIDARRMEVFMGLYDQHLKELLSPTAAVLEPGLLQHSLNEQPIFFGGTGAGKWLQMVENSNVLSVANFNTVEAICYLAMEELNKMQFADLAYCEPFYCKAFYQPIKISQ